MGHQVTTNGFAVDPKIAQLEDTLGDLAGEWRDAQGDPERRVAIVRTYHATMKRLFQRGWDAGLANLGYEQILPDGYMPEEFLRQMRRAAQKLIPALAPVPTEPSSTR